MQKKEAKIIFVTTIFSPFQVDLAYEINEIAPFEYYIIFTELFSKKRGKHWLNVKIKKDFIKYIISPPNSSINENERVAWIIGKIKNISPDIVILGFWKGLICNNIIKEIKKQRIKIAFWSEPPYLPHLMYSNFLAKIYGKYFLEKNIINADFVLGIGDRAVSFYKSIISISPQNVHFVPYGEDLSLHFNIKRQNPPDKITFLFSGQLVKRHNIKLIAKVLVKLYKEYENKFSFVLGGYGPEEKRFWEIIKKEPKLKQQIICDREYIKWEDRIRPFTYSDVLVYPSRHAGWGLVVPEAMASGITVISTPYVEAARYYIKNKINGIIIEPTFKQLLTQMEWCINNKEKVFKMGQRARLERYRWYNDFHSCWS